MKQSLFRIRDVVLIALAWAIAWSPIAILIGTIVDPGNLMDEMWFAVGAYPGFLSALLFGVALWALHSEPLHAISLSRAGALGVVSGIITGTLPFVLGDSETQMPAWMFAAIVIGAITLMSGLSAVATAMSARMLKQRRSVQPARR